MKSKLMWMLLIGSLLLSVPAYAHEQCKMDKGGDKKDSFLVKHRADLSLTDEQVKSIESINAEAQKAREERKDKIEKVLTPEQLAKMKELWKNKKQNFRKHGER